MFSKGKNVIENVITDVLMKSYRKDVHISIQKISNLLMKRSKRREHKTLVIWVHLRREMLHLFQLSYADTHPMFSSNNFPNFFRVVPSENAFNAPRVALLMHFNWTRVGTIYQNEPRFALVSALHRDLEVIHYKLTVCEMLLCRALCCSWYDCLSYEWKLARDSAVN